MDHRDGMSGRREALSETLLLSTSCPLIAIITATDYVERARIYYNYPFIKYLGNGSFDFKMPHNLYTSDSKCLESIHCSGRTEQGLG